MLSVFFSLPCLPHGFFGGGKVLCEEVKICCVAEERAEAGEKRKRSALAYFVEELLKKASGKIVKIYLFGSFFR